MSASARDSFDVEQLVALVAALQRADAELTELVYPNEKWLVAYEALIEAVL